MEKVDVLLGLQWGDEGKGKAVDVLAPNYKIIARFQGGPNAGHTLEFDGKKMVLHQVPSGIFRKDVINVIGNGVVFDPVKFKKEILELENFMPFTSICKKLIISDEAHIILPSHRWLDRVYEKAKGDSKIGSTQCGIGPCYTDKSARTGLRIGDIKKEDFNQKYEKLFLTHKDIIINHDPLFFTEEKDILDEIQVFFEAVEFLKIFCIQDTPKYLNRALKQDKKILAEGAQGTSLDIDFGDYPFVTSSNTTIGGVISGLGIPPQAIGEVFGLLKAYGTRVGSGPFPTELLYKSGEILRTKGNEVGATTGRPRRCGWLDLVPVKRAIMLNGVTQIILSKADVLDGFEKVNVCNSYDSEGNPVYTNLYGWNSISEKDGFSRRFAMYKKHIEQKTGVPISIVSTGPGRDDVIKLGKCA